MALNESPVTNTHIHIYPGFSPAFEYKLGQYGSRGALVSLAHLFHVQCITNSPILCFITSHALSMCNSCTCRSICYTMAARGLPVIHEWSVFIGHEGVARVVYQN